MTEYKTQQDVNEALREPREFGEGDYLLIALDTAAGYTAPEEVGKQLREFAREAFNDTDGTMYDYAKAHICGIKTIADPDETDGSQALEITYDIPAPFAAWAVNGL